MSASPPVVDGKGGFGGPRKRALPSEQSTEEVSLGQAALPTKLQKAVDPAMGHSAAAAKPKYAKSAGMKSDETVDPMKQSASLKSDPKQSGLLAFFGEPKAVQVNARALHTRR